MSFSTIVGIVLVVAIAYTLARAFSKKESVVEAIKEEAAEVKAEVAKVEEVAKTAAKKTATKAKATATKAKAAVKKTTTRKSKSE